MFSHSILTAGELYVHIRTVSHKLKARIPVLFYDQKYTIDQICNILRVKKSLVYKSLHYFHLYRTAHNPHAHKGGRNRTLSLVDIKFLTALVDQPHSIYLHEIRHALSKHRGRAVSITTISRALHQLNFSQKCVSIKA
jgi:transposase